MRSHARLVIVVAKALLVSVLATIAVTTGIHDAEAMPCTPSLAAPAGYESGENAAECLRGAVAITALSGENAFMSAEVLNLWHAAQVTSSVALPTGVGGGCDDLNQVMSAISGTAGVACMLINANDCGLVGRLTVNWLSIDDELFEGVARTVPSPALKAAAYRGGDLADLTISVDFNITDPCPAAPDPEPEPEAVPEARGAEPSGVAIEKVASPQSVPVGTATTWTMTVSNIGSTTLTNVRVMTTMGDPLEPVLPLPAGQTWDAATRTMTTRLGMLGVSESVTVTYDTTLLALSQITSPSTVVTSEGVSASTADDVFGLTAVATPAPPSATEATEVLGATQDAPQLAFTGAETPLFATAGLALVAAGALLVRTSRGVRDEEALEA